MRKTIRAKTVYGDAKVKATVRKCFAVHPVEDDYWGVTYIPTGLKAPGYFFSKESALKAAKAARQFFPYPLSGERLEEWKKQFKTEQEIYDSWFSELVGFGVGEFLT